MILRAMRLGSVFLLMGGAFFFASIVVAPAGIAQAQSLSPQDKARLQAEYDQLQQEIAQWQQVLEQTRAKKGTLQGDVTALNAEIKKAQAEIQQRNVAIATLTSEINQKVAQISTLQQQLDTGHESLAKIIREKNATDDSSLVTLMFSSEDLVTFFSTVQALDAIDGKLQELFAQVRSVRDETQKQKDALADKQNQELDAKYTVEVKKKEITQDQVQKKELLSITTQQETSYQAVLTERQKRAEAIRTALFDLRDTQGISFAAALSFADAASQKTGVRTAMILAILSQESDLGKNIGSCYVTDINSGDGVGKNTNTPFQRVMKAPRDTGPFQSITQALGISWSTTPVSCPLGTTYSTSRGYGGAMGPSQFIPSTWQLFTPRLATALNVLQPNPWNPQDAIMATALYLSDLGASGGTYTSERNAACKYYSGRSCDNRSPRNYTYGDSVIAKAQTFQENIDFLKNN